MKPLLLTFLLLLPFYHYAQSDYDKDKLAFELCQLYAIDQNIRDPLLFNLLREKIITYDSITFNKFLDFVKNHGFPNKELVGEENWQHGCVSNTGFVFLVHNPQKVAEKYLELFKSEVDKKNLNPELLAYALDRYYINKEARSYFDTPYKAWGSANGVCLQDRAKSDSLRINIGLEPLPDSCFIDCSTIVLNNKPDYSKPIQLTIPN